MKAICRKKIAPIEVGCDDMYGMTQYLTTKIAESINERKEAIISYRLREYLGYDVNLIELAKNGKLKVDRIADNESIFYLDGDEHIRIVTFLNNCEFGFGHGESIGKFHIKYY